METQTIIQTAESSLLHTYNRFPIVLDHGEDVYLYDTDQKKYLEEIYHGNQRMVDLVNTLLDVSRIEMGTFIVESKPTDIIRLAQGAIEEHKLEIRAKKIRFSSSFKYKVPLVEVDPKLLGMVVHNLLSNAIKYTPEGGKVEASISLVKGKGILFKMTDTGYGIPKYQQDRIFTKLFRADNVVGKDTEGTGLGLYIAKSIVEQSGGKIWFESSENKGTTFYVILPVWNKKRKGHSHKKAS